ncbi:MAG: hypothetical protein R3D43_00375 [Tepidamorphaceae bacterium]
MVSTIGQAIRREVSAMGDGVERALARANELESSVHNEVTELETAYHENEQRMRSLLDQLKSEREAIIGNADLLQRSPAGSLYSDLSEQIKGVSDNLAKSVFDAGSEVGEALETWSTVILQAIMTSEQLVTSLTDRARAISIDQRRPQPDRRGASHHLAKRSSRTWWIRPAVLTSSFVSSGEAGCLAQ